MKFILIYPEIRASFPDYTGGYSEGVASICSTLNKLGHEVKLIHITRREQINKDKITREIEEFKPDLIGFSAMSPNYQYARNLYEIVKDSFTVPTVIGGYHSLFEYKKILSSESFDFISLGEGEKTLPKLLEAIETGSTGDAPIPGLVSKRFPEPQRLNESLVEDLDSLPFPGRSFFNFPQLRESMEMQAQFMAGRGCPFDCTYCANRIKREMFGCKTTRMKSPRRFIDEIKDVTEKYSFIRNLFFQDDILPIDRKWFDEFAALYGKEINLPFSCNIHPLLINEEICSILAEANCKSVQIGVESGSDRVRKEILNRRMTNDQIIERVNICRKHGIGVATFNMIGNHTETFDEALQTVKLNSALGPVRCYSTIFIPYPGTALNTSCTAENAFIGNAEPEFYPEYTEEPILKNLHFSADQVVFVRQYFSTLVRLYKLLPERLIDKVLHKKKFPFKGAAKIVKILRPLAIKFYLKVIAKLKSRF